MLDAMPRPCLRWRWKETSWIDKVVDEFGNKIMLNKIPDNLWKDMKEARRLREEFEKRSRNRRRG